MPKVALADMFYDWESLLRAAAKHRGQKNMHVHLDKLQAAFDRLHELEADRASLQAQQQQLTQQMGEVKDEGKLAAMEVRQLLKVILGHRNEALVEFNVSPIRNTGPRRKPSAKKKPSA
jgi:regulator of replication initiation timing